MWARIYTRMHVRQVTDLNSLRDGQRGEAKAEKRRERKTEKAARLTRAQEIGSDTEKKKGSRPTSR